MPANDMNSAVFRPSRATFAHSADPQGLDQALLRQRVFGRMPRRCGRWTGCSELFKRACQPLARQPRGSSEPLAVGQRRLGEIELWRRGKRAEGGLGQAE